MPYEYRLEPHILERATRELHEDPLITDSLITELRGRLEETPSYHGRLDDAFLIRFIRYRKFNIDHAKERVLRYYSVRNEQPDVFRNFVPSSIGHMLADGVVAVLPQRDKEDRRVVIYRPGRWNYKQYHMSDFIKTISIVNEFLMAEEETQVCGLAMILDLSHVSWSLIGQFNLSYFKKMRNLHMHASPLRLRVVTVIHGPNAFNYAYKIVETLSPKKLLGKIKNCRSDLSKLHAELCHLDGRQPGLEILPNDPLYGGNGTVPLLTDEFYRNLLDREEQFVEDNKYYVDPPAAAAKSKKNFFGLSR